VLVCEDNLVTCSEPGERVSFFFLSETVIFNESAAMHVFVSNFVFFPSFKDTALAAPWLVRCYRYSLESVYSKWQCIGLAYQTSASDSGGARWYLRREYRCLHEIYESAATSHDGRLYCAIS